MTRPKRNLSLTGLIMALLVLMNAIVLSAAYIYDTSWYWSLLLTLPLLCVAVLSVVQTRGRTQIRSLKAQIDKQLN